ncbi:hypothetical protein AVEN_87760-1, partial [Araneus ventricosus]
PSWKYPRNLESPRVSSPGFGNDSKMMVMVDAVLVCTPTFTHEEIVLKSLRKGKAVFCEKPLALDDEGIERCLDAAKKYNRPLLCAFNRYDTISFLFSVIAWFLS